MRRAARPGASIPEPRPTSRSPRSPPKATGARARREEDVNTVMLTGFYHAFGPVNGYFD